MRDQRTENAIVNDTIQNIKMTRLLSPSCDPYYLIFHLHVFGLLNCNASAESKVLSRLAYAIDTGRKCIELVRDLSRLHVAEDAINTIDHSACVLDYWKCHRCSLKTQLYALRRTSGLFYFVLLRRWLCIRYRAPDSIQLDSFVLKTNPSGFDGSSGHI